MVNPYTFVDLHMNQLPARRILQQPILAVTLAALNRFLETLKASTIILYIKSKKLQAANHVKFNTIICLFIVQSY